MSKILDDAYKALNWMGTNMRPVCINDMDTGYKMELAVKAAGSPNRYYCTHPVAAKMACAWAKMICRTERRSTEITIKTAPKWCPLEQNDDLQHPEP